jgi:hypothetical protein
MKTSHGRNITELFPVQSFPKQPHLLDAGIDVNVYISSKVIDVFDIIKDG